MSHHKWCSCLISRGSVTHLSVTDTTCVMPKFDKTLLLPMANPMHSALLAQL